MATSTDSTVTAADVMTPNPRTCSTFSTVLEAAMIFRDADCGAVPVVDDGKPVGLLTDRDVALALVDHEAGLGRMAVSEIMSKGAVWVAPEASLDIVVERLADKAVRRLLVIDSADQLVGIIAWSDLVGYVTDRQVGRMVTGVVEPNAEAAGA